MADTYGKLDPHTLRVTSRPDDAVTTHRYEWLLQQRAQILASRTAELAEVDRLIAEADALGIVAEPEPKPEPTPEPTPEENIE